MNMKNTNSHVAKLEEFISFIIKHRTKEDVSSFYQSILYTSIETMLEKFTKSSSSTITTSTDDRNYIVFLLKIVRDETPHHMWSNIYSYLEDYPLLIECYHEIFREYSSYWSYVSKLIFEMSPLTRHLVRKYIGGNKYVGTIPDPETDPISIQPTTIHTLISKASSDVVEDLLFDCVATAISERLDDALACMISSSMDDENFQSIIMAMIVDIVLGNIYFFDCNLDVIQWLMPIVAGMAAAAEANQITWKSFIDKFIKSIKTILDDRESYKFECYSFQSVDFVNALNTKKANELTQSLYSYLETYTSEIRSEI